MGFGPLLIGYLITHIITVGLGKFAFAGMLVGAFIMFLGLCELRKYCPTFLYAIIADTLLIICSFFETAVFIDDMLMLNLGVSNEILLSVFDFVEFFIIFSFNIFLLFAIADLSKRVDYQQTRQKAYRNMVFVCIYNVFQLLILLPNSVFENDKGFFLTLLMFIQLFYSFFNTVLIFKCYAMICPAGEEEMNRKPSRFSFVNKMREKQDEREQKAIESTKEYIEAKLEMRNNKNKAKKIHHKKKK